VRTNIRWQGYARKQYFKRASSEKNVYCAVSISATSFGDILEAVDSTPALPLGCLVIAISRPTFHPIGALLTSAAESISERIRTLGRQHEQQVRPSLVSVILPNPQDMQKFQNPLFLGFTFDRHCQVFPLLSRHVLDQMLLPSSRALSCRVSLVSFVIL